jgi:hypothetical protein
MTSSKILMCCGICLFMFTSVWFFLYIPNKEISSNDYYFVYTTVFTTNDVGIKREVQTALSDGKITKAEFDNLGEKIEKEKKINMKIAIDDILTDAALSRGDLTSLIIN